MALSVNVKALTQLPSSLEGSYLFPYEWFCYGLEKGHLQIEDLEFYDTIQGSIYLALCDAKAPQLMSGNGGTVPIWYLYRSGSGEIVPVVDQEIIGDAFEAAFIKDDHLKTAVCYCRVDEIQILTPSDQKTVNNSIIQLFKGCKVKLKHSVWF